MDKILILPYKMATPVMYWEILGCLHSTLLPTCHYVLKLNTDVKFLDFQFFFLDKHFSLEYFSDFLDPCFTYILTQ